MIVHHVANFVGIVLISVAAYASGPLSTAVAMIYVWAGTFSFLFFTRTVAFGHIAAISCAYAVVVATAPGNDDALSRWMLVTVGAFVIGAVASWLIEEIRRLAAVESSTADEKSRLAEAAERQKEYFQSLLHSSPTAVAAMGRDHRVRAWNPAAERLFGHSAEEAIGRTIDELVATSDEVRAGRRRRRASRRKRVTRFISSPGVRARTARSSTSRCSSHRCPSRVRWSATSRSTTTSASFSVPTATRRRRTGQRERSSRR
jgi:PAS domain-containing protein